MGISIRTDCMQILYPLHGSHQVIVSVLEGREREAGEERRQFWSPLPALCKCPFLGDALDIEKNVERVVDIVLLKIGRAHV